MKYLAVDLEQCNMFVKGSVFSVGMVLADENFNILFKHNFWINPLCRFAMKFRKPIDFKVTREDLMDKPTFEEVRDEIAKYLEDKDTIVMAHSANNDMHMLNDACKRANVKPFAFRFICTQMIHSAVFDEENGIGLDKVAVQLGRTEFTHHQADDDSEMALYLLKYCLDTLGLPYEDAIKKLGITPGRMRDGSFVPMRCNELERLRIRRKQRSIRLQKKWGKEIAMKGAVSLSIDARSFEQFRYKHKTIDLRPNDKELEKIKVGDVIFFIKDSHNHLITKTKVTKIEHYASFDEAYTSLDPTAIGYRGYTLMDFLDAIYSLYYNVDDNDNGIVAFHLELMEE